MENSARDEYVAIIGSGYLWPIADLLAPLRKEPIPSSSSAASTVNNGYSASAILLSVALVESFIRRACFVLGDEPYQYALPYVKKRFSDYSRIDALEEIFILRNVIAHNYLWTAECYSDENWHLIIDNRRKKAGGNRAYDRAKDLPEERTKILNLRLFPTAIRHEEAYAVFHEAAEFLLFLERKGNNIAFISRQPIKQGERVDFFMEFLNGVPDPRRK